MLPVRSMFLDLGLKHLHLLISIGNLFLIHIINGQQSPSLPPVSARFSLFAISVQFISICCSTHQNQ